MKITLDGIIYNATPTTEPQPTDKTIVLDGVTYVLVKDIAGSIEKISVNGKVYDISDATVIDWDGKNLDNFTVAGVYDLFGKKTAGDGMPIVNEGVISAKLTVLVTSTDNTVVTQMLVLNNNAGGEGNVYIRAMQGGVWREWAKLQTNIEVGAIGLGQKKTFDNLTDNGIYSGANVFQTGIDNIGAPTIGYETFVLVVVNGYHTGGGITQLRYSIDTTGKTRVETRSCVSSNWSEWEPVSKKAIGEAIDAILGDINDLDLDTIRELADKVKEIESTFKENYEDIKTLQKEKADKSEAMQYNTLGVNVFADKVELYGRSITGEPRVVEFPAATTERAGVMTAEDKKEQVKKSLLEKGDIIVGQAREIHSRNGKTVTDSFLVRTTAGSGTIGDGVATLKSVGGNIVKNLVDGTSITNWRKTRTDDDFQYSNGIYTLTRGDVDKPSAISWQGETTNKYLIAGHCYYHKCDIKTSSINGKYDIVFGIINSSGAVYKCTYANMQDGWQTLSLKAEVESVNSMYFSYALVDKRPNNEVLHIKDWLLVDLTEMFGTGNEPTKEECDKLFGTMDALPQGLSIANPTTFKATGFNQFNPDNILMNKSIVDGAIVDGDKTLAVIPCLPCKVGVGENNGYCIHGEFGEDIKVYLTPLNPIEVEGELYMHELSKDATTDTYVPLIKGYLIVEVPNVDNLCVHLKWSADRNEYDYEPYHESKVKLPKVAEMSEYGLAGIQSSGTLAADTIDFARGVYVKRIGSVDLGSLSFVKNEKYEIPRFSSNEQLNNCVNSGAKNYACAKYPCITNDSPLTIHIFINNSKVIIWDNINTSAELKQKLQGVMLYYELATPEEYPLPKVDNNYISSDYGVEQFDSVVPCNANNLYYMRSLVGETRNFLDKMYKNTSKESANDVADYITSGIENNPLRALFIAAGAEYNDTDTTITKTAPWGESVEHLPKHYYLNGLGDITEEQMMEIYDAGRIKGLNNQGLYANNSLMRTNLPQRNKLDGGGAGYGNYQLAVACNSCTNLEVFKLNEASEHQISSNGFYATFNNCLNLKVVLPIIKVTGIAVNTLAGFYNCKVLAHLKIKNLGFNFDGLKYSPYITKESVLYTIQNASPTTAITITLHHDAYERLTADQEVIDALNEKNTALATEGKGGKIGLVCATHSEEVTPNA